MKLTKQEMSLIHFALGMLLLARESELSAEGKATGVDLMDRLLIEMKK